MVRSIRHGALLATIACMAAACASPENQSLAGYLNDSGAAQGPNTTSGGGPSDSGGAMNGTGGEQMGSAGYDNGTGGYSTGSGGYPTGSGGYSTGSGGYATGAGGLGLGGLPSFGAGGGTMSSPDAGQTLKAECAQKICIDPVFDCLLEGCGAAVCTNFICVIP